MTLLAKIEYLEQLLNQTEENYADTFKADITMFFDDNFSEENSQLLFLDTLNSKQEIENWIEKLTSRFVMKFDSESETENDFIYDYLENG
ncbi:hypothetical protein EKL97_12170 [Flavobacterium sp. LS1P28]|uniref:hypothetical protein n=1 Tax=unclassified Flavobacterium TaxID=196869 RepID=UPI000F83E128|nr:MULTISPECIES: hypothetical protein [unclassified Flavobacterium]RTY76071.1 hypothetical protein EKL96_00830 [Flavobacterium sp. LS1R10]RTY79625.1 hypothetical protein EKL97_12170 [Flavobacterium sp. LS1P28]